MLNILLSYLSFICIDNSKVKLSVSNTLLTWKEIRESDESGLINVSLYSYIVSYVHSSGLHAILHLKGVCLCSYFYACLWYLAIAILCNCDYVYALTSPWPSTISGMECWNGTLEWNSGKGNFMTEINFRSTYKLATVRLVVRRMSL